MKPYLSLFMSLLCITSAFADRGSYSGIVKIFEETDSKLLLHSHNWRTREGRLRLLEKKTGAILFDLKVGAYTYLMITPDEQYIVLLSTIKIDNPYQLSVFDMKGKAIYQKAVKCSDLPANALCSESVTNFVNWFHDEPEISISQENGKMYLRLNAPSQKRKLEFSIRG